MIWEWPLSFIVTVMPFMYISKFGPLDHIQNLYCYLIFMAKRFPNRFNL